MLRLLVAKVNLQQIPKVASLMETLVPRPGWKFVDVDITALEPTIQASFSKDPTLLELYASGKTHDVYLYFAQFIHPDPAFKEELRAVYRPDAETLSAIKKRYKAQRDFMKPVFLAFGYGAGPGKLQIMCKGNGYSLTFEQCEQVHANYWQLLAGVQKFERALRREHRDRGGYILDGFGLPRCIPDEDVRSILNRFVQATGHGVMLKFLVWINRLRKERGVTMIPVIPDLHDETVWQAPEAEAEAAAQVFTDALAELNKELTTGNSHIPFTGGVEIADSFVKFKLGG